MAIQKTLTILASAFVMGVAAAVIFTALPATPVVAANTDRSCLQNNRIWSWGVVNDRTLIVADRQDRQFLVRLTGGCIGLRYEMTALRFQTWTNLGCLGQGDRVTFNAPALGQMQCVVTDVQPYNRAPMRRYDYYDRDGDRDDVRDDRDR